MMYVRGGLPRGDTLKSPKIQAFPPLLARSRGFSALALPTYLCRYRLLYVCRLP